MQWQWEEAWSRPPLAHGNGVIAHGGGHALVECLGRAWHHERGAWGLVLPTSH